MALAGCAAPDGALDVVDNAASNVKDQVQEWSDAQARALLASAAEEMPDRFRMEMEATVAGKSAMTMTARYDLAQEQVYLEMTGDPAVFGDEGGAEFLENGLTMYASPMGLVYLLDGVAYAFPHDDESSGFLPSMDDGPVSALLAPDDLLEALRDDNMTIKSAKPVMHRGQSAVEIRFETEDGDGRFVVFTESKRIAQMEAHGAFADEEAEDPSPLDDAVIVADFYYDDEVGDLPAAIVRASALTHKSDATSDLNWYDDDEGEEGPQTMTWTFQASGGIALGEVQVHVKEMGEEGPMDVSGVNLWTMTLAEGTKTVGNVTVTFEDVDGDGMVSAGDHVTMEWPEDADLQFVLFDAVTETYVVPGLGLWALLAGLGVVAFARRRPA